MFLIEAATNRRHRCLARPAAARARSARRLLDRARHDPRGDTDQLNRTGVCHVLDHGLHECDVNDKHPDDAYDPAKNIGNAEIVGSSIALNQTQIIGSMPNGVGQQRTVRTPVLGPGSYTVGIVSYCQPPDAVNDPQATYFWSAFTFQVTRIPVTAP